MHFVATRDLLGGIAVWENAMLLRQIFGVCAIHLRFVESAGSVQEILAQQLKSMISCFRCWVPFAHHSIWPLAFLACQTTPNPPPFCWIHGCLDLQTPLDPPPFQVANTCKHLLWTNPELSTVPSQYYRERFLAYTSIAQALPPHCWVDLAFMCWYFLFFFWDYRRLCCLFLLFSTLEYFPAQQRQYVCFPPPTSTLWPNQELLPLTVFPITLLMNKQPIVH